MKCPHCFIDFDDSWSSYGIVTDADALWRVAHTTCSACKRATIEVRGEDSEGNTVSMQVWPRGSSRPVAPQVPEKYARDFREACTVLGDSTRASAAMSRRCLQTLLVEKGGAKSKRLEDQIDEVVDSKQLPSRLAENLHYMRKVGNLGAHEDKNTNTGALLDVEPEEAEWLIEVLEGLFDHYFVAPERERKRREEFDQKLTANGKQPVGATAGKGEGEST